MSSAHGVFERVACDRALGGVIGESDCELLRDGFLAQPVLAWTSLAYALAAVGLVATTRIASSRRWLGGAFVVSLALIGVGSFLFHGPQPDGTRWIHDVPIVACLLAIVAIDVVEIGTLTSRRATIAWTAATAATGIAAAVVADAALVVGALAAVVVVIAEIVVRRPRRTWIPLLVIAAAAVVNILGRTGGPLCDPDSTLQWHGVWHVMTAGAFFLWGRVALAPLDPPERHRDGDGDGDDGPPSGRGSRHDSTSISGTSTADQAE